MNNPEISFLTNSDIDRTKWDQSVASSSVPLVYALSGYLDLVAPGWNALVLDDYQYVMPLVTQRKLGFSFLMQPIFAQQHGIFPQAGPAVQSLFLNWISEHFKYVSIHLNTNHSEPFPEAFKASQRVNYILNLSLPLEELRKNYSKHCRRQVRKAEEQKVTIVKGLKPEEYVRLKQRASGISLTDASMQTLKRIMEDGISDGSGEIYAAYTACQTLCSAAFFLFSGQRVIYLNAASDKEGKANSSMYRIVDQFISEHAGQELTLDFEGSSIPGIARFYAGFGAKTEYYYNLKLNRLPVPLRWFKK